MEQKVETTETLVESSAGSDTKGSNHISRVRKLLCRRMLVGIKDGRFFLGSFHCIDKQGNIILQDAVEYRSTRRTSPSPMEQRCLGIILIPSSCRTSCHVDCSIDEQLSLLKVDQQVSVGSIENFNRSFLCLNYDLNVEFFITTSLVHEYISFMI